MTTIRRELPRSNVASSSRRVFIADKSRGFSFRRRPIRSQGQGRPDKPGEFAGDGRDDVLRGFPARGPLPIAPMQPLLCVPSVVNDGGRGVPLAHLEAPPTNG